jgi:hypothetical protein
LPRSGCGTGVFRTEIACKSVEIAKFPVSRELQVETDSYLTAHTTIQSDQTAHFVGDCKEAVSAWDFGGIVTGLSVSADISRL